MDAPVVHSRAGKDQIPFTNHCACLYLCGT